MLELRKIDRNNVWQVARLKVKRAQADYVASNIESILERLRPVRRVELPRRSRCMTAWRSSAL